MFVCLVVNIIHVRIVYSKEHSHRMECVEVVNQRSGLSLQPYIALRVSFLSAVQTKYNMHAHRVWLPLRSHRLEYTHNM